MHSSGNGKTISIKVIMKDCDALGFSPMYVKSFHCEYLIVGFPFQFFPTKKCAAFAGDEYGMQLVFGKARQNSPCVVILEDLDSLINDSNRSFFLNELDGLSSNDGLLVIGTTNHFDRLDPGISTRPSRFDRKLCVH
jgi:transitional endoplasmic reticulum ATPase